MGMGMQIKQIKSDDENGTQETLPHYELQERQDATDAMPRTNALTDPLTHWLRAQCSNVPALLQ